jgi:hypothetical protein
VQFKSSQDSRRNRSRDVPPKARGSKEDGVVIVEVDKHMVNKDNKNSQDNKDNRDKDKG